ncbi:ABC transporter ATP-binding protein [Sedimentibacter sp. zth1]|uniref:ABC transporter ATP-binding protein n=1 Tax=Sedimentibacter sp. zth1 TaxID=2816908 RepID=UPI001A91B4DB|nr:ABC transporter ATP-binding protein [Sedimentibacter sp. zth1]QSX05401.1 ABC transporter ATP-binding protein [Sedimentibacter sp. zth1]
MREYLFKHKLLFFTCIVLISLLCVLNVYVAFVLQMIIDCADSSSISKLLNVCCFVVIFLFLKRVLAFVYEVSQNRYLYKTQFVLKQDIFKNIMKRNIKLFKDDNSANYISALTNDIKLIENDYFSNVLLMILYVVLFILGVISMISINPILCLYVTVTSILPIIPSLLFGEKVGTKNKKYSDSLSKFTVKIKDLFTGFEVIKGFNIETKANKDYQLVNEECENTKYKYAVLKSFVNILTEYLGDIVFFGTTAIGVYFTIKGDMTVGSVIAATQLMNCIVNPVMNLSGCITKFKAIKPINEKIMNLIINENIKDTGISKKLFTNSIRFDNVEFGYTEDKKILNGLSFEIKKGEKYAIVGGSGSGKSTLIKLLLRFYDDFNGQITIDEQKVTDINYNSLYNLISTIQQNVFMFDDTIENNILLYNNYDLQTMYDVIEKSGLKNMVEALPQKEKSIVGENGSNLSGGEKQRIAIARALIKETPILVLDEATSSLDNENAYNIENSILSLKELTCLVVTHKLNKEILMKYDKILVLKNGKVEEIGTFEKLINDKSYFYNLYNVAGTDVKNLMVV